MFVTRFLVCLGLSYEIYSEAIPYQLFLRYF